MAHRVTPYAHRGDHAGVIENSDRAVQRAASRRGFWLETDVRASADGQVVLAHDASLKRSWGVDWIVGETRWSQLASLEGPAGEHLTTLPEVLEAYPTLHINIDPKDDAVVQPLLRVLRDADALDRVLVASFSANRIEWIRAHAPEIATGASPVEVAALVVASATTLPPGLWARRFDAVQVPPAAGPIKIVTPRFVATCHRLGVPVHVWTVNDRAVMERMVACGVDGIMSDDLPIFANLHM